jgi:hypothetical protein
MRSPPSVKCGHASYDSTRVSICSRICLVGIMRVLVNGEFQIHHCHHSPSPLGGMQEVVIAEDKKAVKELDEFDKLHGGADSDSD